MWGSQLTLGERQLWIVKHLEEAHAVTGRTHRKEITIHHPKFTKKIRAPCLILCTGVLTLSWLKNDQTESKKKLFVGPVVNKWRLPMQTLQLSKQFSTHIPSDQPWSLQINTEGCDRKRGQRWTNEGIWRKTGDGKEEDVEEGNKWWLRRPYSYFLFRF